MAQPIQETESGKLLSASSEMEHTDAEHAPRSRNLSKLIIAAVGALALLAVGTTLTQRRSTRAAAKTGQIISLVGDAEVPTENLADGNKCDTSEEEFANVCFTKCSILTNNVAATRVDAFTCCPKAKCSFEDMFDLQTDSLVPCTGYDVSSADGAGKSCPHQEGVCLKDEEQFAGVCYEQCSILTQGKAPVRVGPLSCCAAASENEEMMCLNPFEDDTNLKYYVGGETGGAYAKPHAPDPALTETVSSTVAPAAAAAPVAAVAPAAPVAATAAAPVAAPVAR